MSCREVGNHDPSSGRDTSGWASEGSFDTHKVDTSSANHALAHVGASFEEQMPNTNSIAAFFHFTRHQ